MVNYNAGQIYKIWSPSHPEAGIYYGSTCQTLSNRIGGHHSTYKSWSEDGAKFLSSFNVIKYEDHKYERVCYFPCNSKKELCREEGRHIKGDGSSCNKIIAGRTHEEYIVECKDRVKNNRKKYRENNKEKIKEYRENNKEKMKEYYENNKEEINKKTKIRRENNSTSIRQKNKKYRENNKEKIKEYYENNKEKIKEYRKNNKEKMKKYYEKNKEVRQEYYHKNREKNKEKVKKNKNKIINCQCGSTPQNGHKARHEKTKKHIKFINSLPVVSVNTMSKSLS
jgi:hypothetical protein